MIRTSSGVPWWSRSTPSPVGRRPRRAPATTGTARRTAARLAPGWPYPRQPFAARSQVDHSCRVDVRPQRGVGVDDLADHPDRRLRREPEQPLQLGVEPFLHIMPTAHPRGMHPVRQPGRGLVADSQGLAQRSRLILGRQHAHLDHLLHTRTLNADTDRSSAVATVSALISTLGHMPQRQPDPYIHRSRSRLQLARPPGLRHQIPAPSHHRHHAHLLRTSEAQRVHRHGHRAARVQRRDRPRQPTGALPAQPPDIASWSTDSTACRLAGYASSIPPMCGNTCGAGISGHRPTSPPPAEAHP